MEISPIPGLRALPAVKPQPRDSQLSALFDIEGLARPGDSAPPDNRRKAAGAEEEEDDDLTLQAGDEAGSAASGDAPAGSISYFA